jgi:diaminopimelate decarboxylase
MRGFPRPDNRSLSALAARFDTPLWVYDTAVLSARLADWRSALDGLDHQIRYAVKANGSLALLQWFARSGTGFDVVSAGELARVEQAGGDAANTVFSGVGKRSDEIDAALASGIGCLNCESADELATINARAEALRLVAPVGLRVNPGVDALTHPHIATGDHDDKFGIPLDDATELARHAATLPGVKLQGLAIHIGSQLTDLAPLGIALDRALALHDGAGSQRRWPDTFRRRRRTRHPVSRRTPARCDGLRRLAAGEAR